MPPVIPVTPTIGAGPGLLGAIEAVRSDRAAALPLPPGADPEDVPATARLAPPGTTLVLRTSGSTGRPRHVALSEDAVAAAVRASLDRLGCEPGERWALALPAHHVAGLLVLLRARALGTDVEPVTRPGDPAAIAAVRAEHVALVPTQLVRCVRAGVDLTRFRTVLVGGGPLAPEVATRARERGVRLVTTYGATETCGGCVYDGLPLDGVRVDVGPDGGIRIGGPTIATGYLDDDDATAARFVDGWFVTGDRGSRLDGRLTVEGRRDDVVVSGGVNVPLPSVTAALQVLEGVVDAVAIGVPDPEWGTVVRAVVVAGPDAAPRLGTVREAVTARLPRTWAPRELLVVARLPRNGVGKLTDVARRRLQGEPPSERLA